MQKPKVRKQITRKYTRPRMHVHVWKNSRAKAEFAKLRFFYLSKKQNVKYNQLIRLWLRSWRRYKQRK